MLKMLVFILCLIIQGTFALFVNLRILQFYKKNIDVKYAFYPKQDLNLSEALEINKHYKEILERG